MEAKERFPQTPSKKAVSNADDSSDPAWLLLEQGETVESSQLVKFPTAFREGLGGSVWANKADFPGNNPVLNGGFSI